MSTATETVEQLATREYKYGFETTVDADTFAPGLNEDVIRRLSAIKEEPELYWLALPVLLAFVVSLGLWQLYPWARILALVFYALLTVAALASAFNNPFTFISLVAVLAPALLVIYLLGKHARKAFEHEVPD